MYDSEHLGPAHDLTRFDSGQATLDTWLRQSATGASAKRTGRTFVWHDQRIVVAYYTLSAHLLSREALPRKLGRGDPEWIPAVLLGRLALDKSLQGRGLGGALLVDALRRVVVASEQVAARYVAVDAIDQTAFDFYEHYDFVPTPRPGRLVRKISDIAADLEAG